MTKNFISLLLTCILTAGFSACTGAGKPGSSGAIGTGSPEAAIPQGTAQAAPQQGTGDSGGGNLYKGRPLESYIQNPEAMNVTKKYINPINSWLPSTIAKAMAQTLRAKNWYFVPGPLQDLPKEKIGSAVQVEQGALQDFSQVWIDKDLFEKMSEAEQAQLIVHELLMGIKLLRFDSPNHACLLNQVMLLASLYSPRISDTVKCGELSKTPLGRISDLSPIDYSQIRFMASSLLQDITFLEKQSDHTTTWWMDQTAVINGVSYSAIFNGRPWLSLFTAGNFSFQQTYIGREMKFVNVEESFRMISTNFDKGYRPTYGFNVADLDPLYPAWKRSNGLAAANGPWNSTTTCNFTYSQPAPGEFEMEFKIGNITKKFSYSPQTNDFLGTAERNYFFNSEVFEKRTIFMGFPQIGNKRHRLAVYFDLTKRLRYVEYSELLREGSVDGELIPDLHSWQDNYLKGELFLCGLEPQIQLTTNRTQ